MKFKREQLALYAVTDRSWTGRKSLYEQVEASLKGGVTLVQLREKHMDDESFIQEAVKIKDLCHRYGVPLIINDNVKVARESGADGVHVGQEDCSAAQIREMMGQDFIIGVTAKTVAQALRAQAEGADYLGVGAVFPSPTKAGAVRVTHEELKTICGSVRIPAVAIGGISLENMTQLKGCKMCGFAVVSAIFAADDVETAARQLKAQAEKLLEG